MKEPGAKTLQSHGLCSVKDNGKVVQGSELSVLLSDITLMDIVSVS